MGCYASKKSGFPYEKNVRNLGVRVRLLQEEVNEMICVREKESRAYDDDVMIFALKEAEWKRERKRLKQEVKRLKKMVEEREDRIRGMEGWVMVGDKCEKELPFSGSSLAVEQIREERVRRDETVEKWKQLYLAIRTELDDLIQRTHHGEFAMYWKAEEEDTLEELKMELKAKAGIIEAMKEQLASMELEKYQREREIDILRQSLRIMSSKNVSPVVNSLQKFTLVKQAKKV